MALPSSPPLLPETDLPTSPPLLSDEAGEHNELPIRPSFLRKRTFSDYGSLSSDPLFSASSESGIDERENPRSKRKKRHVRGPWWSLRRDMARRNRVRVVDSGVFLGSDMSEDGVEGPSSSQETTASISVEDEGPDLSQSSPVRRQPSLNPDDLAAQMIISCLDNGQESVDLMNLNLSSLSNATLKPLHQLIKHSHRDLTQPPSEDEFSALTPSIQLFISGNKLTSLPSELFRLTNISVLSLRNNELQDIPPSIGQLSNLQEFNIAQNNIRWLPWEMFDLFHCRGNHRQIIVRPNPLINPVEVLEGPSPLSRPRVTPSEYREHLSRWGETNGAFFRKMQQWYTSDDKEPWTMRHELELRLKLGRMKRNMYMQEVSRAGMELNLCKEELIYLASSAVRFFDARGSPYAETNVLRAVGEEQKNYAVMEPLAYRPDDSIVTSTPSLFELALKSIQSDICHSDPDDFDESIPPAVSAGFRRAVNAVEYGSERCGTCNKVFIVARAEWMEYWFNGFPAQDCLAQETILPFLRRVCSWQCAQPNELGAFCF